MRAKIHNNKLSIYEDYKIDGKPFFEIVKPVGHGCKINCPKKHEGKKVLVAILK